MATPLFADLNKGTNDLFVKDYKDFSRKIECASQLRNGLGGCS